MDDEFDYDAPSAEEEWRELLLGAKITDMRFDPCGRVEAFQLLGGVWIEVGIDGNLIRG